MSSNSIYNTKSAISSEKSFHYVYLIRNISTNKKYIGVHSSDVPPVEDIGINYFSSSTDKEFLKDQKLNPQDYSYHVLREDFDTREEAEECESKIHATLDVANNEEFYNLCNAPLGFRSDSTRGLVVVRDKNGKTMTVPKDDSRYLSGELVSIHKGLVLVKDSTGKCFKVSKDDPLYIAGELVSPNKGLATVKDSNGKCFKVETDDERYLSGELVPALKGRTLSEEHVEKMAKSKRGVRQTDEHKRKISDSMKGEKNPCFGRTGEKHPMYGRTGENAPGFGRTGEKNPCFGRTGEKHPMYGRTGEKNPTSKPIQTPDGIFASRKLAAEHYKVALSTFHYRMKKYPDQYFYTTK